VSIERTQTKVAQLFFFTTCQPKIMVLILHYNLILWCKILLTYALYALCFVSFMSLCASFYAWARVEQFKKALNRYDWEVLADLTGEVGALKRSIQKTNGRITGMTNSDPSAVLANLPKLQMVTNDHQKVGG